MAQTLAAPRLRTSAAVPGRSVPQRLRRGDRGHDIISLLREGGQSWLISASETTLSVRDLRRSIGLIASACVDNGLLVRSRPSSTGLRGTLHSGHGVAQFVFTSPAGRDVPAPAASRHRLQIAANDPYSCSNGLQQLVDIARSYAPDRWTAFPRRWRRMLPAAGRARSRDSGQKCFISQVACNVWIEEIYILFTSAAARYAGKASSGWTFDAGAAGGIHDMRGGVMIRASCTW